MYRVKNKLWRYSSEKASWFFITIPKDVVTDIREERPRGPGWGQVRVEAQIDDVSWKTSLFPEKGGTFLIAIKKDVRQKVDIAEGDTVSLTLTLL